jgi:tellurite resistance protein
MLARVKPSADLRPLATALLDRFGGDDEGLAATVDLAVLVAMADDHIDAAEKEALASAIEALMGGKLASTITRHLVADRRAALREAGVEASAHALGKKLGAHGAAELGVRLALAMAWTSDGLSREERAAIALVATAAGLGENRFHELVKEAQPA